MSAICVISNHYMYGIILILCDITTHMCHFWVEAGKAQVWFSRLSFLTQKLYVPDGAHVRVSWTTNDCRLWWVCVCVWMCMCLFLYACMCMAICVHVYVCIYGCVCVSMCVCMRDTDIWGSLFPGAEQSLLMDTKEKEDLKRRQNLSLEAGTFLDLLFLLCLPPKLLLLSSPCFLCWAWLFLSHHFWFTNNQI